jgi:hypothetical protein
MRVHVPSLYHLHIKISIVDEESASVQIHVESVWVKSFT